MANFFAGASLKNREGVELNASEYLEGKVVGVYFSASWCPPCRAFTPKLKTFFEEIQKSHPEFQIVFVSRDRNSEDLVEYFMEHHGDWTYLPYGSDKITELFQKFEVKTIPTMRIVNQKGEIVVKESRTEIQDKGENAEDLWKQWFPADAHL